jgi:hypothetical protein
VKFLLSSERQKKKYRAISCKVSSNSKKGTEKSPCIRNQGEEREEVREKGPMRSKEKRTVRGQGKNSERTGDRGIGSEKRTVTGLGT